jgi:hypothetical protein
VREREREREQETKENDNKTYSGRNITSSGPAVKKYIRLIAEKPVFMIFGRALQQCRMYSS